MTAKIAIVSSSELTTKRLDAQFYVDKTHKTTRYEVPIVYKGQANFVVDAESPEEAIEKARAKFNAGDKEDVFGNEWESIERVGDVEVLGPTHEYPRPKPKRRRVKKR